MIILRLTFLIIISIIIGTVPTYADPSFSKVIVFGDSNVDSGQAQEGSLYNLSNGIFNAPPNVGGRSCNGPVVVEYVAEMLGVPLVDYGVGGAMTGEKNIIAILWSGAPPHFFLQGFFRNLISSRIHYVNKRQIRKHFIFIGLGLMTSMVLPLKISLRN